MEKYTVYVVQFWVEGYEYWADASEPAERMFGLPVCSYETEEAGRARFDELVAKNPTGQYRLINRTTTQEVI